MRVYSAADAAVGLDVDKDAFDKFRCRLGIIHLCPFSYDRSAHHARLIHASCRHVATGRASRRLRSANLPGLYRVSVVTRDIVQSYTQLIRQLTAWVQYDRLCEGFN